MSAFVGILFLSMTNNLHWREDYGQIWLLDLEGLALTKDGVHVREKLVGASDHDHLIRLAFFFLVVERSNFRVAASVNTTLYC